MKISPDFPKKLEELEKELNSFPVLSQMTAYDMIRLVHINIELAKMNILFLQTGTKL